MPVSELSVNVARKPGSLVEMRIEAPADEVDAAVEAALRRLAARIRIPGFRPGKAPAPMVERALGWETVRQDAVDHLVPELYRRALDQTGVVPVTETEVNVDALEREHPLTLTATVTVRPDVDLRDYHAIRVQKTSTDVTDEAVDQAIADVRRRHAELIDVTRPAQAGDVLRCTLVMRRGDEVLSAEDSGERDLELDRESVMPGIVDGIIGLAAGDQRSFDVTLPQDYPREELRGATVTIDVTVHAVRERKLPPLDDSLAALDGHGESLAELREHYRNLLTTSAAQADQERFEADVLATLRDQVRVDVPDAMVEREIERQLNDLEYRLSSLGIPMEKYLELTGTSLEKLRSERRETAMQRVRLELALDGVAAAEGLEVDESQVQREAGRVAGRTRLDATQRRRLTDLSRRDLLRQAAAQRMLEIGGDDGSGFVQT